MKVNLIAGFALGLFSAISLVALHQLGLLRSPDTARWMLALTMTVHSVILILALLRHRAAAGADGMPFSRFLGAGLFISFLGGVISAISSWVFVTWVDPSHLEWVRAETVAQIQQSGLSGAELEQQLAQLPAQIPPAAYAIQALRALLIMGLFLSVVIAALLRLRGIQVEKPKP